jgi:hypothetical protein
MVTPRAAWYGTRIVLRQVSSESNGIFDFIIGLYESCSGDWDKLVSENYITQDELHAFLEYAATFLSNMGNYYVGKLLHYSTHSLIATTGIWRPKVCACCLK